MHLGDFIHDAGQAKGVIGPAPLFTLERELGGHAAIDVGVGVGLDGAITRCRVPQALSHVPNDTINTDRLVACPCCSRNARRRFKCNARHTRYIRMKLSMSHIASISWPIPDEQVNEPMPKFL
jgi:hypothetical protein